MSDKPWAAMTIVSAETCGFYVSNTSRCPGEYGMILGAFTTLDEAIAFVRREMSPRFEPDAGQEFRPGGVVFGRDA